MAVAPENRPYPFNLEASSFGENSILSSLLVDAVNEIGEKNAPVLIAKYQNQLINAANKVVGDVNRHPYFLQILEIPFQDGVASVTADSTDIQIVSGFSAVGPYTPLRIKGVGYGVTGSEGDLLTFTIVSWMNGQSQLRIADAPHITKANAVVTQVFKGRISIYIAPDDRKPIHDRVIIEGIKYYWSLDRDAVSRGEIVTKNRVIYYTELNTWLGQLRNVLGILEIDHDQRGADY